MRKVIAAAVLVGAVSLGSIALAQVKPIGPDGQYQPRLTTQQTNAAPMMGPPVEAAAPDARAIASDQEVGEARRAYRAACDRIESTGFCECVTAGVAQALHPSEVLIAARGVSDRIMAQGDAAMTSETDSTAGLDSSAARIEQVEGHYADLRAIPRLAVVRRSSDCIFLAPPAREDGCRGQVSRDVAERPENVRKHFDRDQDA